MPTKTALFATCLVDQIFPGVAEAALRLLEKCQRRPEFPLDQTCCGQPVFNMGYDQDARAVARHTISCFEAFDEVVTPSGSCAAMLRVHYPRLFDQFPEDHRRAVELAERTFELTEFLDRNGFRASSSRFEGRVAYHPSCHLFRELEIREAPVALLEQIPGLELVEIEDAQTCCGFGGAFAVKMENLSTAMLEAKIASILASGANVVTATDSSCLTHLAGAVSRRKLPLEVTHIAEILATGS